MADLASAPAGVTITYRQERRKCGNKKCRRCDESSSPVGHGPYWYAYWHDPSRGNKLVSGYVGKNPPAGYEARRADTSPESSEVCSPPRRKKEVHLDALAIVSSL